MADSGRSDDPESLVANLPLTAVFGTHPKARIVGALLTEDVDPPTAFSANELSRIAGVDEGTVEEHVADLRELGIVVDTDELDEGTYELTEGDVVADIRQLNDHLAERIFRAEE